MARAAKTGRTPGLDQVLKGLEGQGPEPLYVLVGADSARVGRVVDGLRARVAADDPMGMNQDVLDGQGLAAESVIAAARTVPMMAPRRWVLVRGAHRMDTKELEKLVPYLADPCATACVVITAEKLDGRGAFAKAAKKAGVVREDAPLKPRDAAGFVVQEANRLGHALSRDVAEAVVETLGADVAALTDLVERVSLYVGAAEGGEGGAPIRMEDVRTQLEVRPTQTVWVMVDALGQGDVRTLIRSAATLLQDGEAPLKLLAMVSRQVRMISVMHGALAGGQSADSAAKAAGVPPFKAREMAQVARKWSTGQLGGAAQALADLDVALKSSRVPGPHLFLESMLRLGMSLRT